MGQGTVDAVEPREVHGTWGSGSLVHTSTIRIPTTSVDEYAATLARWFGVAESDTGLVLPNWGQFASTDRFPG